MRHLGLICSLTYEIQWPTHIDNKNTVHAVHVCINKLNTTDILFTVLLLKSLGNRSYNNFIVEFWNKPLVDFRGVSSLTVVK